MQTASPVPPKGYGKIQVNDFWKGLLIAAGSNVLLGAYAIINTGAFPTTADWIVMIKSTIAIIISYLLKNFSTNNAGQLFKKDVPVVEVSAPKLDELQNKAEDNEGNQAGGKGGVRPNNPH